MNVAQLIAVLSWEPWRYTPQEIVAMTPGQIRAVLVERDRNGEPQFEPDDDGAKPVKRGREAFDWWAHLNGVPKFEADRIWKERQRGEAA